jgi:hypothetical protein
VGKDLLKKGVDQPSYYQTSENEKEDTIPGKPRRHDKTAKVELSGVNEDLNRMKGLFSYNTNKYANAKPSNNPNTVFEQQLNTFRVLTESVDTSDRPNREQLLAMKTVIFEGNEAKSDGKKVFNAEGKCIGECGAMEEALGHEKEAGLGIKPKQFKAGSEANKKGYDISKLDEGKETGGVCTECGHKIYEKEGKTKCQCAGEPKPEKSDAFEKQKDRMNKLGGVKTEAKNLQLKHTKGNQLKTGTKGEIIEEKEPFDNGKQHPVDSWLDKKKAEKEDKASMPPSPEMGLHENAVISEVEQADDFFKFVEKDPRLNTWAFVYYASNLDAYLAKRSSNPMVGKFLKSTRYKIMFGQTYKRAAELKNPEYIVQQRKGDYEKVQGYNILEFDKNGNLVLPIIPLESKYKIIVIGENGVEDTVFHTYDLQTKYAQYFVPSFFGEKSAPASGTDFRALKVDSISRISAGGAVWNNPNFKYKQYEQDLIF